MDIRGFQTQAVGTYVLMDDVIAAIREYAQSLDDPHSGGLIHDLATWLDGGQHPLEEGPVQEIKDIFGAEESDATDVVDRIEVYPDPPDDPRPKWYARTVDTSGYIIKVTSGSFDQSWVIENAEERWPGRPIHLLKHAGEDSKWVEDAHRGAFPSVGPPTRRLWDTGLPAPPREHVR